MFCVGFQGSLGGFLLRLSQKLCEVVGLQRLILIGFDFADTLVGLKVVLYKRRQIKRFSLRLPPLILRASRLPILRDKVHAFPFPRRRHLLDLLNQFLILFGLLSCLTLMNHPVTLIGMPNCDFVHHKRQMLLLHMLFHQLVHHLLIRALLLLDLGYLGLVLFAEIIQLSPFSQRQWHRLGRELWIFRLVDYRYACIFN